MSSEAAVLPVLMTTTADLTTSAGGGNCSSDVECNSYGGNACYSGACACIDRWRGEHCEEEVTCRAWVVALQEWAECIVESASGGGSVVSCRCEQLGEMVIEQLCACAGPRRADIAPQRASCDRLLLADVAPLQGRDEVRAMRLVQPVERLLALLALAVLLCAEL